MLPEMAVSYCIGLLPSLSLTGLHLVLHRKKLQSPAMSHVQGNLAKIGLFWHETESSIRPLEKNSFRIDRSKYRKSVLVLGGFCFFLSWLGFFIQILIMASLRFLAVSRLEQRLFSSELATQDLDIVEVRKIVDYFRELEPRKVSSSV